ncbi:DUF998 domain-containing protein [Tengunoibacter tsumagoiensis]|uniref:DUF998 domain-containing protein n=1 Tax=Tengunoibacter tsumagoiensis TaxID=2014871 RepID=A0A402A855_9CHLR|nr:DUF998 domain-containing protein [Tengunoibacter tsumagoiensis]GCE15269.1 hypothetical protein KTT_51280 [Tengunoibacter tsumagoiensis]
MSQNDINYNTTKEATFTPPTWERQKFLVLFFALINIATPLLFVIAFIVNGLLRPGYSPIRQPISDLELGPLGWTQNLTFVICGLFFIIANVGIYQTLYPMLGKIRSQISLVLMILSGCGLVLGGIFTEGVSGHPVLWHDFLHILGFHLLFDLLSIALFVIGSGLLKEVRWRSFGWYSLATGLLTVLQIFGPYFYNHGRWTAPIGGLLQRSMEIEAFLWYVVLGVMQLKRIRRNR